MKKLMFVTAFLMIGFSGIAQDKKLIADETYFSALKSSVKVQSSNKDIVKMFLEEFKNDITRYSVSVKTDRLGKYQDVMHV